MQPEASVREPLNTERSEDHSKPPDAARFEPAEEAVSLTLRAALSAGNASLTGEIGIIERIKCAKSRGQQVLRVLTLFGSNRGVR